MITYSYFLKRLLQSIPTLFGITLVCFIIFHVAGNDPALQYVGKNATVEQIASVRHELGVDQPLYKQYFLFLKQTIFFDWGESWHTHENINQLLLKAIGPSLSLTLPSFFLSFVLCLMLALYATHFRETWINHLISVFCMALMSVSFVVYIIVYQYFFSFSLGLFPINGWDPGLWSRWHYLFLPWLISISVSLGPNLLIYRSVLIDEASSDYITTAIAKGLSSPVICLRHILKNAMIPISTNVISQIPFMMTGSLLLEAFFGIPGLGGLLMQSIQHSDFPVIKAMTFIGALVYMFFHLLSDFVYTLFDPRVRLQ